MSIPEAINAGADWGSDLDWLLGDAVWSAYAAHGYSPEEIAEVLSADITSITQREGEE